MRDNVEAASGLEHGASVDEAVARLGNGSNIAAQDTVGFALWCAVRHVDDYTEAMWTTVSGLGDRDTTCAIVGGIVSLGAGRSGLPNEWLERLEPLRTSE